MSHQDIRIGTLAGQGEKTAEYIRRILPHGFESFQINFWKAVPKGLNLKKLAEQVRAVLEEEGSGAVISSLAIFGNPLMDPANARDWARCIDAASAFGCKLVAGFAGAISGKPVPESLRAFKKVFGALARRAEDRGVRLVFENCPLGGTWQSPTWNIAFCPDAWELMFDALPTATLGLEWEPCHQMCQLIDPLPQLRQWAPRIYHLHGKDATILWDVVKAHGIQGGRAFAHNRTPGFGDSNWTDIISFLRLAGFQGSIDIEGWHDPVYCGEREMTGQVHALHYLKQCRGGPFVAG